MKTADGRIEEGSLPGDLGEAGERLIEVESQSINNNRAIRSIRSLGTLTGLVPRPMLQENLQTRIIPFPLGLAHDPNRVQIPVTLSRECYVYGYGAVIYDANGRPVNEKVKFNLLKSTEEPFQTEDQGSTDILKGPTPGTIMGPGYTRFNWFNTAYHVKGDDKMFMSAIVENGDEDTDRLLFGCIVVGERSLVRDVKIPRATSKSQTMYFDALAKQMGPKTITFPRPARILAMRYVARKIDAQDPSPPDTLFFMVYSQDDLLTVDVVPSTLLFGLDGVREFQLPHYQPMAQNAGLGITAIPIQTLIPGSTITPYDVELTVDYDEKADS
jgi:hypothetical protein